MVTVFGILNLTEDSFFDESRRLDPAGAVTAAIEMLRVGSDVVDVGPAASHPDARPVSPADEIRRIAPLLDALSDQMHRVSIDRLPTGNPALCAQARRGLPERYPRIS